MKIEVGQEGQMPWPLVAISLSSLLMLEISFGIANKVLLGLIRPIRPYLYEPQCERKGEIYFGRGGNMAWSVLAMAIFISI